MAHATTIRLMHTSYHRAPRVYARPAIRLGALLPLAVVLAVAFSLVCSFS